LIVRPSNNLAALQCAAGAPAQPDPKRQRNDTDLGQPNLVITGKAQETSPGFLPTVGDGAALKAVRSDGFAPAARLRLPDGRVMTVWWKDRGSCGPSGP
jgi:hypothetical protein